MKAETDSLAFGLGVTWQSTLGAMTYVAMWSRAGSPVPY